MVFGNLLNPVFSPLLALHPAWIVFIISAIVSILITVIYKLTTNQSLMKDLKSELKEFQKEMKELRDNPKEMMAVQKKAMQTNMKYMSHSMKSTLFTFIPVILIFGWMNANVAFEPVFPGQEFSITAQFDKDTAGTIDLIFPEGIDIIGNNLKDIENNQATWTLKGQKGDYLDGNSLQLVYKDDTYYKDLIIDNKQRYSEPIKSIKNSDLKSIKINNKEMKILKVFGLEIGWLWSYIIFSIIFSMTLRKWMKVY
jgi:uncharacterized membrane protein (DUF106 family)